MDIVEEQWKDNKCVEVAMDYPNHKKRLIRLNRYKK